MLARVGEKQRRNDDMISNPKKKERSGELGSKFYENELKKEQQVNQRIGRMMKQAAQITEQQLQSAQAQVDKLTAVLERGRELGRVIVHVDMDAFYAAVEMRDRPELKEKPMAVGSWSMLSTSNYHARKFGVRAAMPGFIAKKLCPNLIIAPLNFDKYRAVSLEVREIFAEYDENFLAVSLDEAYLDVTDHLVQRLSWPDSMRTHLLRSAGDGERKESVEQPAPDDLSPVLFEDSPTASASPCDAVGAVVFGTSAEEAVREMRFRIEQKTALTASAGIAPNMMLAKVCSDKNKPNGQYRIPAERQTVMDFIQDLPIRKVPGIGKVTEKMLSSLGITTCAELRQKGALLSLLFSETSWHHFLQISLGLGSTNVERDGERKSMSTERTFAEMSDAEEQYGLCRGLCRDLSQELQKEGLKGKTVTVKLKNVNFEVKTRALTLSSVVSTEEEIFAAAKDLLKAEIDHVSPHPLKLRLMGVRLSGFVSTDDKKPLQKSIIGFLRTGQSESGGATQHISLEHGVTNVSPEKSSNLMHPDALCNRPAANLRLADQLSTGQTNQEVSKPESGPKRNPESFFQRAHRLRLQANQQEFPGVSDTGHVLLNPVRTECFTCPVCFREQESMDLEMFNRHVDKCLSGSSNAPGEKGGSVDAVGDCVEGEGSWQVHLSNASQDVTDQRKGSSKPHGASGPNSTHPQANVDRQPVGPAAPSGRLFKRTEKREPSLCVPGPSGSGFQDPSRRAAASHTIVTEAHGCHGDDRKSTSVGETPAEAARLDPRNPNLVCPVCSVPQETTDLVVFNRHVDVCLSQGILQELGQHVTVSKPSNPSCTRVKGFSREFPRSDSTSRASDSRGKHKREGSPPPPAPHKRAKAVGSLNTIDKFFR
ncbi:DNA polymerase kappa isoform X2 [Paramormyrops kingsleyae]|uniref:DNA polymerase kappa isoform X2 n=1 Tax=Paramormyrops kingsleyae TaxID=1676925 RepID=UPI003B96CE20